MLPCWKSVVDIIHKKIPVYLPHPFLPRFLLFKKLKFHFVSVLEYYYRVSAGRIYLVGEKLSCFVNYMKHFCTYLDVGTEYFTFCRYCSEKCFPLFNPVEFGE